MTFKYIVWNTMNKEFIDYCDVCLLPNGTVLAGDLNYDEESGMLADVTDHVNILFYSGVNDIDNKEIYDKAIIEFEDEVLLNINDSESASSIINRAVVNVDLVGGKERIYLSDFRINHTDVSTEDFESGASSNYIVSLLEHSKVKGYVYEYNELLKSIKGI